MKTASPRQESLIEMLKDFQKSEEQINHWLPRFFSLYLEGNYENEQDYKLNVKLVKDAAKGRNFKGDLRHFITIQFGKFLRAENFKFTAKEFAKSMASRNLYSALSERTKDLLDH